VVPGCGTPRAGGATAATGTDVGAVLVRLAGVVQSTWTFQV
jgi:hypothetical protein